MDPSEGSSLSSGFSARRSWDAITYNTSSATNGSTPRASAAPRPGCWLISLRTWARLQFSVRRELHVAGVEAHLEAGLVAQRGTARELDAHDVHRLRAFAQEAVVEGELAHQVHLLDQVGTLRGRHCVRRGPVHVSGGELALESSEIRARRLGHGFQ